MLVEIQKIKIALIYWVIISFLLFGILTSKYVIILKKVKKIPIGSEFSGIQTNKNDHKFQIVKIAINTKKNPRNQKNPRKMYDKNPIAEIMSIRVVIFMENASPVKIPEIAIQKIHDEKKVL